MKRFVSGVLILAVAFVFSKCIVEHVDLTNFPDVQIIFSSTASLPSGEIHMKENGKETRGFIKFLEKHYIETLNITFVIDTSGSMNDDTSNVLERLDNFSDVMMKQGLNVRFTVILYGNRGMTRILRKNGREVLSATELKELKNDIIQVDLGGAEAHMEGLKRAMDVVKTYSNTSESAYNLIVLMTDEPLLGSDVDRELNKRLMPEVEKEFLKAKNTNLLALLSQEAFSDTGFREFVNKVGGWIMNLSTRNAARTALEKLQKLFTNVYELKYRSYEKVLDGSKVILNLKKEILEYEIPLRKRRIFVESNLKGVVYINDVRVGYTNEKIEYYEVIPPTVMKVTGRNLFPRTLNIDLRRNVKLKVLLAPKRLTFHPFTAKDFGGFKPEEVVIKGPYHIEGVVGLAGFLTWRYTNYSTNLLGFRIFEPCEILMAILPNMFAVHGTDNEYYLRLRGKIEKINERLRKDIGYYIDYNSLKLKYGKENIDYEALIKLKAFATCGILSSTLPYGAITLEKDYSAVVYNRRLKEKVERLNKELKTIVDGYNSLAMRYERGEANYEELVRAFQDILKNKNYEDRIDF